MNKSTIPSAVQQEPELLGQTVVNIPDVYESERGTYVHNPHAPNNDDNTRTIYRRAH